MSIDKHPSRKQIIEAVKSGSLGLADHFKECEDCRLLYELLTQFRLAGELRLPLPPSEWTRRAIAIAEQPEKQSPLRRLAGRLTFDSWTATPAVQVRGAAADERRLRFETDEVRLDLRAERDPSGWQFVARVSDVRARPKSWTLVAGTQIVSPDDHGFFLWTAALPPEQLVLQSGSLLVEVTQLSWAPPSS